LSSRSQLALTAELRCDTKLPIFRQGEIPTYTGKAKYNRTTGILYLTNQRLMFEYEQGHVSKKTYVSLDLPLPSIQNATTEKPVISFGTMGKLVITTANSAAGFGLNRIEISTDSPSDVWVSKIAEVASSRNSAQQPTVILEKEVARIPCKYCGNLVDPARQTMCPRCGARPF